MTAPELTIGTVRTALGARYTIERELGRGGMGAVFLARDRELDRPVALKVLPPEFALVPDLRERFLRETRTAAGFSHPNIVPVFSVEDRDGLLAFAMGYVEGESLSQRIERSGPLSVRELVRLLQDVGYALAYAHGRGVVHRDIKPDNIMLERATGRALLMDFGISRTIRTETMRPGLTRVGEVVGTPEFMSPEQAAGDELTGRSDLYSLGLVAWFAATGVLAISGESTQKIIVRQITETIPPIGQQRADLPAPLAEAIDRCLQKDPDARFASAEALVEMIDAAQLAAPEVPLPIRAFGEEAATAVVVLFGGIAMGVLLYYTLKLLIPWDLDRVLPVVLFGAMVWGRLTQTLQMAHRLALRGFGVAEIQRGLGAIMAEHDDDRTQLRTDPRFVRRRRVQIVASVSLFAFSYVADWYALTYQRVLQRPGVYGVLPVGVFILYAVNVMKGMAIVSLIRSPFRRPVSEWVCRWFWLGLPGRVVLSVAARRVPRDAGAASTAARVVVSSGSHSIIAAPPAAPATDIAMQARVQDLERRVSTLEQREARSG